MTYKKGDLVYRRAMHTDEAYLSYIAIVEPERYGVYSGESTTIQWIDRYYLNHYYRHYTSIFREHVDAI